MNRIAVSVKARFQSEVRRFRVEGVSHEELFRLIKSNITDLFDVKEVILTADTIPVEDGEALASVMADSTSDTLLLTVEKIDSGVMKSGVVCISETASRACASTIQGPEAMEDAEKSVNPKEMKNRFRERKCLEKKQWKLEKKERRTLFKEEKKQLRWRRELEQLDQTSVAHPEYLSSAMEMGFRPRKAFQVLQKCEGDKEKALLRLKCKAEKWDKRRLAQKEEDDAPMMDDNEDSTDLHEILVAAKDMGFERKWKVRQVWEEMGGDKDKVLAILEWKAKMRNSGRPRRHHGCHGSDAARKSYKHADKLFRVKKAEHKWNRKMEKYQHKEERKEDKIARKLLEKQVKEDHKYSKKQAVAAWRQQTTKEKEKFGASDCELTEKDRSGMNEKQLMRKQYRKQWKQSKTMLRALRENCDVRGLESAPRNGRGRGRVHGRGRLGGERLLCRMMKMQLQLQDHGSANGDVVMKSAVE